MPIEDQLQWRTEWEAWRTWRARVEAIGVLVFQFAKVGLAEVRGISLLHAPLPVVGINRKEIPEGKSFTLLHEVVHLMLAAGEEEKPALLEKRSGAEWQQVERFAAIAASYAPNPGQTRKAAIGGRRDEFATPPEEAINRNGRPFVQLVLEALDANRITSVDAGRHLDLKFEHFGKLRGMLSQRPIVGSLGSRHAA